MKVSKDYKVNNYIVYNVEPIKHLQELQSHIMYFKDKFSNDDLWFRGVSNSNFRLIPSIYRESIWDYNNVMAQQMTNEFVHKGMSLLSHNHFEKWEWYHLMQHYSLPTRLLDWSEGYLIALHFALKEHVNPTSDPCVWLLEPYILNKCSNGKPYVYFTCKTTRDRNDDFVDNYIFDDSVDDKMPEFPIAIFPPHINSRLNAQKSCFTIHGSEFEGFEKLSKMKKQTFLVKLIIDKNSVSVLKKELVSSGITEAVIFPDFEGLSRELIYKYIETSIM